MAIERNARTEIISGSSDAVDLSGGGSTISTIVGASFVPVPPPILIPTPKGALGPLGFGMAVFPPGSMAMVVDDATGPTPFVLAYVDGFTTWVRCDTSAPIS